MIKSFFLIFIITSSHYCTAQLKNKFILEAGLIARIAVGQNRGANTLGGGIIRNNVPYSASKGVDGTGLNIALGYRIPGKYDIAIRSGTTFRYDFLCWKTGSKGTSEAQNTLYVDQAFFFTKGISKENYIGIGATMFNIGKEIRYTENGITKTFSLDFNSIDLLLGTKIWKVHIEPKVSYVPKGFPGKLKETATIIGARVYYLFKTRHH